MIHLIVIHGYVNEEDRECDEKNERHGDHSPAIFRVSFFLFLYAFIYSQS